VAQAQEPAPVSEEQVLEVEAFIETYKIIADWIRFADTKAAATLTVNGILLGLLIPTLRTYLTEKDVTHWVDWWPGVAVVLFVCWLLLLVISAINSFLCILPLRGLNRVLALTHTTHFHPAAVTKQFPLADVDQFAADCAKIGINGFKREVQAAILIDAHLSSAKYAYVTRSIWCLAYSVVFGFLYLLAIQF
jgi:hypothetical protein